DAIWQGRIVSEATLSSRISAARRALGDSGNDQSLIRTLRKRGFRFVGHVDDDPAPAAIAIEKGVPPQDAADDMAKLVPTGEPLPDEPSIATLSFETISRDPDQEYVANGHTAAAAPRPALADRASDAAGEYAIFHDERAAGSAPAEAVRPAPEEKRAASNGRWAARNLLTAQIRSCRISQQSRRSRRSGDPRGRRWRHHARKQNEAGDACQRCRPVCPKQ